MAVLLQVLLVVGGLLPLVAMLSALFAAVWIREGRPDRDTAGARCRLGSR
jgi:hypothetical protein